MLMQLSAFAGEGVVRFEVRDSGEGIAPEHLPYIFDKFYRVNGQRKSKTSGAGLGLAIAREIVVSVGALGSVERRIGALTEQAVEALCFSPCRPDAMEALLELAGFAGASSPQRPEVIAG